MARRRTVVVLGVLLSVAVLGPVLVIALGRADEPATAAATVAIPVTGGEPVALPSRRSVRSRCHVQG